MVYILFSYYTHNVYKYISFHSTILVGKLCLIFDTKYGFILFENKYIKL